jgi:transcription initiation factor IIE alpha subunit
MENVLICSRCSYQWTVDDTGQSTVHNPFVCPECGTDLEAAGREKRRAEVERREKRNAESEK